MCCMLATLPLLLTGDGIGLRAKGVPADRPGSRFLGKEEGTEERKEKEKEEGKEEGKEVR